MLTEEYELILIHHFVKNNPIHPLDSKMYIRIKCKKPDLLSGRYQRGFIKDWNTKTLIPFFQCLTF